MDKLVIKIINRSANLLPTYATSGSSGMDIRANIDERIALQSLERIVVPTGLFIQLPTGYEAQVRPRSGMAMKYGITCLNSPGTIDSDYRGEIKVILVNLSNEPQSIEPGDRIAQMVFQKVETAILHEVQQIDETKRGEGGFGHTGKQ